MKTSRPVLEVQTGKLKGQRLAIVAEEVVIGRGADAKIRITSLDVSRAHCRLTVVDNTLVVEDLDSRNGTFVDGRPLRGQSRLLPGQSLTIGPMTFVMLGGHVKTDPDLPLVRVSGRKAVDQSLSDDEIVSWLSETRTSEYSVGIDDKSSLLPHLFRRYQVPTHSVEA